MIYIVINFMPIFLATLAGIAVSAAFYRTRLVGGSPSAGLLGLSVTAFLAEFWLCSILAGALILAPPKAGAWMMALGSAYIIWVGFLVPALILTLRLRGQPWRAVAFDCGHWLVVMLVQAIVLKSIGLIAPPV